VSPSNEEKLMRDIELLNVKVDKLQLTLEALDNKLTKHIGFIDKTYEGLRNPIDAAKRFLKR
jgi:hypothetical protein|tara:strand:- start:3732 stop:3917 length:186 start_codon:yes stop_codon:yes gene_type:complete